MLPISDWKYHHDDDDHDDDDHDVDDHDVDDRGSDCDNNGDEHT